MSGGFFRGTSADQDTRFSNKQAKLLKSQKFPSELDHLVDTTKVKMDVIKPWIATRVTELLGFEDEVLINFVYGLLDRKEVDGKQIQIQLTGFMEKNTAKFMKELWGLLLSAQNNVSGVPQQFLDAKEEEMRKKKAETERITHEIQKRKEKEAREVERGKIARMDGEADIARPTNAVSDSVPRSSLPRASSVPPEEGGEVEVRHHHRRSNDRYSKSPRLSSSPHANDHSPSARRRTHSATRSSSNSLSRSRSYSGERHKSRSVSVSCQSQRLSISPERRHKSPTGRSFSKERRYKSPRHSISPRRRHLPLNVRSSPRSRRRSSPWRRSPSPYRRRSPYARRRSPYRRGRSPSPLRRRSPSPLCRRSPSPSRRRSRSPSRRRSPIRRRSPSPPRRRSPIRRRSPSPLRRRSPPRSLKHRRLSPYSPRSRADSQISPRRRNRSRSPYRSRSPSRERDRRSNGVESRRYRDEYAFNRTRDKDSPLHHDLDREVAGRSDLGRKISDTAPRRLPISLRSPQRDLKDQTEIHNKVPSASHRNSPNQSQSTTHVRKTDPRESRRSHSLSDSPVKQIREHVPRYDSPETSKEEEEQKRCARVDAHHRNEPLHNRSKDLSADKDSKKLHAGGISSEVYSPNRTIENRSPASRGHAVKLEVRKDREQKRDMDLAERHVRQESPSGIEYGPGKDREERISLNDLPSSQQCTKKPSRDVSSVEEREYNVQPLKHSPVDVVNVIDGKRLRSRSDEYKESRHEIAPATKAEVKVDKGNLLDRSDSDSEEIEAFKNQNTEKRKHKKSVKHKKYIDDSSESDSQVDDRKEAKRRRKDERRLRKEDRRRRREEKHRRRLERRASKLKLKSMDMVAPPSNTESNLNDSNDSDDDAAMRKDSDPSDAEEPESEQKKLEIELRKKALESLRAKKAISH